MDTGQNQPANRRSVKILGMGCPICKSMVNDVNRIIARNGWQVEVEYVQDVSQIMSYRVFSTPVLVIDEKVVMVGHHGPKRIEEALRSAIENPV